MRLLTTITILFFVASSSIAQTLSVNTDTLVWQVTGFYNSSTGNEASLASQFTSQPDAILWSQNSGSQLDTFTINSQSGTWADASQDGSVTFNVTWKTLSGTLQFQRVNGQASIVMSIMKDGANITPFQFSVSQVTKN